MTDRILLSRTLPQDDSQSPFWTGWEQQQLLAARASQTARKDEHQTKTKEHHVPQQPN